MSVCVFIIRSYLMSGLEAGMYNDLIAYCTSNPCLVL